MTIVEIDTGRRSQVRDQLRRSATTLHPDTVDILVDIYTSDRLKGTESDNPVPINAITRISIEQGAMIHKLICDHAIERSLEIGFAFGFSTIWILDALRSRDGGRHIAVDPFEKIDWGGIGLYQVGRLSPKASFDWKEDFSIHALSDFIRHEERFDFIYIDGNHRFDDVVVDFYLSDQILKPGGLLVLDDMWMPSVQTAVSFVLRNRNYKPVPQPVKNMIVLKKVSNDNRRWSHFKRFAVGLPARKRLAMAIDGMVRSICRNLYELSPRRP
jgi:predicted O-methyltransferase YrrM